MLNIQTNVITAPFTSWLTGGVADNFCQPETIEELVEAQVWAQQKNLPLNILSGGSNVLISDKGLRGLTVHLKKISQIEFLGAHNDSLTHKEQFKIVALSGARKSDLLKIFLKNKLGPALFLAGIPGDVGGGVVMNAGVAENMSPREFGEIVEWIEVLKPSGDLVRYESKKISWSYRSSKGWQPGIITRVGISVPNDPQAQILEQVRDANRVRLQKQPLDKPSCGSVFKNPPGKKAAQLIDSAGLKGHQIGDAQVSIKHANFIVNLGQARAADIWDLIEFVKKRVKQTHSVDLQTEVIRLGEWT